MQVWSFQIFEKIIRLNAYRMKDQIEMKAQLPIPSKAKHQLIGPLPYESVKSDITNPLKTRISHLGLSPTIFHRPHEPQFPVIHLRLTLRCFSAALVRRLCPYNFTTKGKIFPDM